MDRVIAAQVYMRICELGSLSAAARALGMSRPMVSRYLEQMEQWAGTRLIHRSTRKLTLTPAGEKVLQKTRTLTQLADEIAGQSERAIPSGTLRVACAHFTAMQLISPLLPDFLARYPQLRLELDINNHPVSLIGERIDVAIRITDNPEPGAIARRLGVCRSVLCASPRWLQHHGPLRTPEDLAHHNCLHYSHFASQSWQFTDPAGDKIAVAVSGNLSAGISSLLLEAAVAGCGIAMLPELEAQRALNSGALKRVLPAWQPKALGVYGVYLSRDYPPSALPLFLEAIQQTLTQTTGRQGTANDFVSPDA
ncbi:LysR family transcriptional regulator [Klebsiella indica]|uniref:LysR family transcriptional regulator n=1 Tax=Klebsiella TaxID=570 RepID=UPI002804D021|nr:LysR family transcriptional regulator [uncultured Klebsiella sp.]